MFRFHQPHFAVAIAVAVGALVAIGMTPARAQQPGPDYEKAREHFAKAEQAMQSGDFKTAASEYMAAHAISADPVLLLKTGIAHQSARDCPQALGYFRRYLAEGQQPEETRKQAEERIATCERESGGTGQTGAAASGTGSATGTGSAAGATGGSATGDTAAGGTATGDTAAGGTATGDTAAGGTATGDTAAGGTATGDTAAGVTMTGTATGDTATGTGVTGDTATGDTAAGNNTTGDADTESQLDDAGSSVEGMDALGGGAPPSLADQKPSWQRNTAWVAVGTTLTFVTVGSILGMSASSHEEDIRNLINFRYPNGQPAEYTGNARAQYEELVSEGQALASWSRIAFVMAAASAATAAVFFIIDPGPAAERNARIVPTVSPDSVGVSAGWRF